ncbi:MAG: thiamine pyrophosphate-binding protein [Deltaproteobacteria bacterium]|nr:thiamine pyrophosphate-binding protein [Deltaproteobacteria bacterium]
MRVADYVIQFFENLGVEHIFTVSGGGSIFLCDALGTAKKMKYVACHHEQAASMATEAYARVRNDLGVTLVTVGPGATNTVTGVAGSWLDHVPHVTISGQIFLNQTICKNPGLRTMGVQEIDIVSIVKPITKYAVMIEDATKIRYHLEKAVYLATHGRPGPVWIDIPGDIQKAEIDPKLLHGFEPEESSVSIEPELKEKVKCFIKLLQAAKRPLLHVGQGVRISGAEGEMFELIEKYKLPFVTARNANDITSSDHELFVGRPGTFAQRGANFAVQTSDLYLAVGTRLSLSQTGFNSHDYARNAKTVMVDVDWAELNKKTLKLDLKIQADAKLFFQELLRQLSEEDLNTHQWASWIEKCQTWKHRYPVVLPEFREQVDSINSYHFIDVLSDVLTPEDTIVTDMGFAFQNTHQAFRVKKGQRMFTNCGLASMGWGLPAAVGACFGSGKKRTICLAGEGGLMMTIQEMATIMHHRLPVKLFVFNNGGYLTIKQTQEFGFGGRLMGINAETGLSFPDFMKIAEAYQFKALRLDSHESLRQRLEEVVNFEGPVFCEIMMDHNQLQAPRAVNRKNSDGTMKQTPLEDSYPFLDQREVQENLNIAS